MRAGTIFSVMAIAFSGVALAQVTGSPSEQKIPDGNVAVVGNDMLMTDNSLAGPSSLANASSANATAEPVEGDPVQATSVPPRA